MINTFEGIFESDDLNSSINELVLSFVDEKFLDRKRDVNVQVLKKAAWLSSILAESEDERHKKKVQTFAILSHLYGRSNRDIDKLCYVILARTGNLLASKFLNLYTSQKFKVSDFVYDFGEFLNLEILEERRSRIIEIGNQNVLTTSFQLDLWTKLRSRDNITVSAPTSAGKSFIIQNFILDRVTSTQKLQGLYIVPTRALINQVSEDLRSLLPDVEIRVSFILDELAESPTGELLHPTKAFDKIIYILTPERCLKLLQHSDKTGFKPNFVFVDEIQNLEDGHGRGTLFEYVLENISVQFPETKIITAGPFIKNESQVFNEMFRQQSKSCSTTLAPVIQFKVVVRNTSAVNQLQLTILEEQNQYNYNVSIPVDFNLNMELQKNKGTGFAKVIRVLNKAGEQSIVYCPKTDLAESWALKLELQLNQQESSDERISELIDFLSEEIHPKYYLIKCLKKKIAFHHSKLPDLVRKEIEDLFKADVITFIYCTATLLQGVNLPANNMFVTSPKKRTIPLTSFEFGNLIGRAGRINDSLYGMIYCIEENDDEKQWAEQLYTSSFEKNVTPITRKTLEEPSHILENIDKKTIEIKKDAIAYTITKLRQRFLEDPNSFISYLITKDVDESLADTIDKQVRLVTSNIEIPSNVISLNPTIDPLLQNELMLAIKNEGVKNWVIIYNDNFYKPIGKDYLHLYKYEEYSFYWQIATLCEKLDSIFKIANEAYFKQDISLSIRQIAFFGFRWLEGRSLRNIILDV